MPAASHHDAIPSSASDVFACATRHCVGVLQILSPSDVDRALVASCPPDTESTTLIDIHDASSSLSSATSSPDVDRNDVSKRHHARTFGVVQLQAGFVWLYHLVTALVLQVVVIASDVVSLKARITAVEGTQTPALVHGLETETLARQVSALSERVASQQERIAGLERSHRAETDSYKKTIRELAVKLDDVTVDDDKKGREDVLEDMCQSLKKFQQSMECQAERMTGVKDDSAREIALLQLELAGVQTDLAAVKTVAVLVNASSAS